LSLLRPPQRHDQPVFPSYAEQERGQEKKEESGLDALERRLAEQVGTLRPAAPFSPPDVRTVMADPPPAPVPAPVPVPGKGKGKGKAAPAVEELESADEALGSGAAVNESAISSLALGAEEDFGGRNANINVNVVAALDQEGDVEDVEGEDVDVDADGRTQRWSKGAGASSGSERDTHKARSRKSAKSDPKDKEKDKEKKAKKKREGRDETARLKSAAKGRVTEWLEKLGPHGSVREEQGAPLPSLPPEPAPPPALEPEFTPAPAQEPPAVVESKPNPRSSGFISVATLRRAPISLPPPLRPDSTSITPQNEHSAPAARQIVNGYPPSQVEMKYGVKSARGGRGGHVTTVAAIWSEAANANGAANSTPTPVAKAGGAAFKSKGNPAQTKVVANKNGNDKRDASTPKAAPRAAKTPVPRQPARLTKGEDGRVVIGRSKPSAPAASPAKAEKEDAPPVPRALFGLGAASAATPSSPALSSSIATPVLSSTASLAQPPGVRPRPTPTAPPSSSAPVAASSSTPSLQAPPPPPQPAAAKGWRTPLVSAAGLKTELAFGQARLRDLIRRYQGQAA